SLVLTVAGFASILMKGGLKYGIEFKGGALMNVKFAGPPDVPKIRQAMGGDISVQNFTESGTGNEVEIATELKEERQLNASRQRMLDILNNTFGQPQSGKLDFNNAGRAALADRLREPLARGGVTLNDVQLQDLARNLLDYRDTKSSGLVTDFNQ